MKILKIIVISVLGLVLAAAAAIFIFLKTFDINRFKPQIIEMAGKALHRGVDFEKANLGISLRQGISLKINKLVIADDPAFGKDGFLKVKSVSVAVNVLKYLTKKEVNLSSVYIDSLHLNLIRKKDGTFNAATIAQSGPAAGTEGAKSVSSVPSFAVPAVLISSVGGNNGTVVFIDQAFDPPLRLEITDLSFFLQKISLSEPFPFLIEGAVLSAKRNIKLEGKLSFNLPSGEVSISGLKGVTQLSDLSLAKIPVVFPLAKGAVLPEKLGGRVDLSLHRLVAGAKGLTALQGEAVLSEGILQFKEIASPLKDIALKAEFTEKNILLVNAALGLAEGTISGSGVIEDYLAKQEYSLEAEAKNIVVQNLVHQDKSSAGVEGVLSGTLKLKGQGFSPEALKTGLSGTSEISLAKAKLKNINVLRLALDKLAVIPGLSEKIETGLSEKQQEKLAQKDTELSEIKLPLIVENGRARFENLALQADDFIFNGSGEFGFDNTYAVEGLFLIPEEISSGMISEVKGLQYLLNDNKQIAFPLKVSGKAGAPSFSVDVEYITKRVVTNQAKQQIFKALDKAIGVKDDSGDGTQSGSVSESIVGGILDSILK